METETSDVIRPGDPRFVDLDIRRKFGYRDKMRARGLRYFVAFNHKQNGNLLSQFFDDVWEQVRSDDSKWVLVEEAREKIEAFRKGDWVENVTVIEGAVNHEEAIRLAREKFNMGPIEPLGVRK